MLLREGRDRVYDTMRNQLYLIEEEGENERRRGREGALYCL